MRAQALLLVLVLVAPLVVALPQPEVVLPPERVPEAADLHEALVEAAFRNASRMLGQDLTREDVRIFLDVNFTTLDFDLLGILFGGGTFEAHARMSATVEFRAISVARINEAIESQSGGRANLTPLGLDSAVITADVFRSALVGEALAAFEAEQERAVATLIEETMPDVRVLSTRFAWSNTDPVVSFEGDPKSLLDPPIVLDAVLDIQYLKRESLLDILDAMRAKKAREADEQEQERAMAFGAPGDEARKAMIDRLQAENQGAFYERSAFSILGLTQLLAVRMEPGWDLEVDMTLPKGFTFEYASADVDVDPSLQAARTFTWAGTAGEPVENPVAVSVSNRYLVTVALLLAVLLAGIVLRVPVLLVSNRLVGRAQQRDAAREPTQVPVALGAEPIGRSQAPPSVKAKR